MNTTKETYQNTTKTNLEIGNNNLSTIESCVMRGIINASINIKKYNPDYNLYENQKEEMFLAIMKEIKSNL